MCMNSSEMIPNTYTSFRLRRSSKRLNLRLRVQGLNRMRRLAKIAKDKDDKVGVNKVEMEIKNLKLYMENQNIMEENNKLRNKALLLHQENQALLSQLQKKFSLQNTSTTTTTNNISQH